MASMIQKLGAGILAAAIPFGAVGCGNKGNVQETAQVKHFSELFKFKRDAISGKIFVAGEERMQGVKDVGLSQYDLEYLREWRDLFNVRASNLKQVEIKVGNLPKSPRRGEQKVVFPDNFFSISSFNQLHKYSNKKGQPLNLVIFPVAGFRDGRRPLAITINDDLEFMPDSATIKSYLYDSSNRLGAYDLRDEGLSFTVRNKDTNGEMNLIVPLQNLPLTIDAGDKMYLIGLDNVQIGEGKVTSVNMH